MHTGCYEHTVFNHNSDLSGDVIIRDLRTGTEINVPGADLLSFVADHVRQRRISEIAECGPEELLGIAARRGPSKPEVGL